jgi:hypothetical protein
MNNISNTCTHFYIKISRTSTHRPTKMETTQKIKTHYITHEERKKTLPTTASRIPTPPPHLKAALVVAPPKAKPQTGTATTNHQQQPS